MTASLWLSRQDSDEAIIWEQVAHIHHKDKHTMILTRVISGTTQKEKNNSKYNLRLLFLELN